MTQNFLATVVASNSLTDDVVKQIASELKAERTEALTGGKAARFYCEKQQTVNVARVDVFWQKLPAKPIKLMVCDMESTIIDNEFLDEMADYLGVGEKVAAITKRAMNGELGFEESLHERLKLVAPITKTDLTKILTRLKYNEGAKELLAAAKKAGVYTMLVSGGFTYFTEVVAKHLGFDEHHANRFVFSGENIGGVEMPILGKEAKLKFLQNKVRDMGIDISQTITMGDGANDLPMLRAAGVGVAYKAKPVVKQEIVSQVNVTDLSAVAYLFPAT